MSIQIGNAFDANASTDEIKLGEFLAEMRKDKGGKPLKHVEGYDINPPILAEIGISRNLSSEAQVLATLPEPYQNDVISGKTSKKAAKKKHIFPPGPVHT